MSDFGEPAGEITGDLPCFRVLEVMRDYGTYERGEAPQYYPPVERR